MSLCCNLPCNKHKQAFLLLFTLGLFFQRLRTSHTAQIDATANNSRLLEQLNVSIQDDTSTIGLPPHLPIVQELANPHLFNTKTGPTSIVYIAAIAVSCSIGIVGFITAGICWYRARILIGLAQRAEYPAYGGTSPNSQLCNHSFQSSIDINLNRNAEVFHYNETKKKIKAASSSESSRSSNSLEPQDGDAETELNDVISDEEYTVYECSGLASLEDGPMEIYNPLFDDMSSKSVNGGFSYLESVNAYQLCSLYNTALKQNSGS